MIDYAFNFGDTQCHLTAIGTKTDLAVNGVYQGSGEPYEPLSSIPAWVYVMLAINTIGPFILGGGILGAAAIGVFIGCLVIQALLAIFILGAFVAINY